MVYLPELLIISINLHFISDIIFQYLDLLWVYFCYLYFFLLALVEFWILHMKSSRDNLGFWIVYFPPEGVYSSFWQAWIPWPTLSGLMKRLPLTEHKFLSLQPHEIAGSSAWSLSFSASACKKTNALRGKKCPKPGSPCCTSLLSVIAAPQVLVAVVIHQHTDFFKFAEGGN